MSGTFEYAVLIPSFDFKSGAIAWSMLGLPGALLLPVDVLPVQSPAMPASCDAPTAAVTHRPSSTVTCLVRSTPIGPALVKAESVSRKTSGLVTVGVVPVGPGPCAPHLNLTVPHDVKRSTRYTGSVPEAPPAASLGTPRR